MKQRVLTGLIAFSVFALIVLIGKWALFGTILCMNALCLYEYLKTLSKEEDALDIAFFVVFGSGLIIASIFSERYMFDVLIGGILLTFIKSILRGNHDTERTIYSVWGFIYISLFLALATEILFRMDGFYILIVTILACIACDTFAYLFGIRFGKHKLAPGISPKKSVEGSIAGFSLRCLSLRSRVCCIII
jgi:phosphatidate cytidylyltransferase